MKKQATLAEKIILATTAASESSDQAALTKEAYQIAKAARKVADAAWRKARKESRKAGKLARLARRRLEKLELKQKKSKSRSIVKRRSPKQAVQAAVDSQTLKPADFHSPTQPTN